MPKYDYVKVKECQNIISSECNNVNYVRMSKM